MNWRRRRRKKGLWRLQEQEGRGVEGRQVRGGRQRGGKGGRTLGTEGLPFKSTNCGNLQIVSDIFLTAAECNVAENNNTW
jgi:hypothetical protein